MCSLHFILFGEEKKYTQRVCPICRRILGVKETIKIHNRTAAKLQEFREPWENQEKVSDRGGRRDIRAT